MVAGQGELARAWSAPVGQAGRRQQRAADHVVEDGPLLDGLEHVYRMLGFGPVTGTDPKTSRFTLHTPHNWIGADWPVSP
jgi:hypothetical protein